MQQAAQNANEAAGNMKNAAKDAAKNAKNAASGSSGH